MLKKILWLVVLSGSLFALPREIDDLIEASGIPKRDISIIIKATGSEGGVIAQLHPTAARKPASVIKLLTIYAALLQFGSDYRFKTAFYRNGPIRNGVLMGDLIVKGYGDPTLSSKDLPEIAKVIRDKGVSRILGDIVIDRSYFRVGNQNSSYFDEYPYSPYNAMPDAMMFNERVSTICVNPRENDVAKQDTDRSYRVINRLQKVNKPCRGRYSWPQVKIDPTAPIPKVILVGEISRSCGERKICKVVTRPYLSFYYAFREALREEGIEAKGTMRLGKLPQNAVLLTTHLSVPLEVILAKTAKESNNLYARHLLLHLGADRHGSPATVNKGRDALIKILKEYGALNSGFAKIDNGSGLSRKARLDAKLLAELLDHAYLYYGEHWMELLSIAGIDGTLKRRFAGSPVKGRAWMKTGTLRRVKNIAGYVKSQQGSLYTVVILVNTAKDRSKAEKLQDKIIAWLVKSKHYSRFDSEQYREDVMMAPSDHTEAVQVIEDDPYGRFYVQTGLFEKIPPKAYLLRLEKYGLPYRVQYSGRSYKVLVGPYAEKSYATEALKKVKKHINKQAFLLKDE